MSDTSTSKEIADFYALPSLSTGEGLPVEEEEAPPTQELKTQEQLQEEWETSVPVSSKGKEKQKTTDSRAAAYPIAEMLLGGDTFGGMAGSLAGGFVGTRFGRPIAGSAVGTAMGEAAEDLWQGKPVDFGNAGFQGALDAGLNMAIPPAARFVKDRVSNTPAGQAVGDFVQNRVITPVAEAVSPFVSGLAAKAGFGAASTPSVPEPPLPPSPPQAVVPGSPESIETTQRMLTEGGGSLSAKQAGAGKAESFLEGIGEQGLTGRNVRRNLEEANAATLGGKVDELTGGPRLVDEGQTSGQAVTATLKEGKEANAALYKKEMEKVTEIVGDMPMKPSSIIKTYRNFLKEQESINPGSVSPTVRKWINEQIDVQRALQQRQIAARKAGEPIEFYTLNDLTENMRILNRVAKESTEPLAERQSKDTVQLLQLREKLALFTQDAVTKADATAGAIFKEANKAYGTGKSILFNEINKSTTSNAINKGAQEEITDVLRAANIDKVQGYMETIGESFRLNAKNGGGNRIKGKTQKEVVQIIRREYLSKIFKGTGGDSFKPSDFVTLAESFGDPAKDRAARVILGEDGYGNFKKLLNAIVDSSVNKRGDEVGSLALKQAEFQSISNIATGAINFASIAMSNILLIPGLLARVISNPKAVNKLVAALRVTDAQKKAGKVTQEWMDVRVMSAVEGTIEAMNKEEDK